MVGSSFLPNGRSILCLLAWALLPFLNRDAMGQSPAQLAKDTFPASGKHQTLLTVKSQGRYSLRSKSAYGSVIAVVDAMAGVLARSGAVGQADGRIDLLLEVGTYLIRLEGTPETSGQMSLSIAPFTERENAKPQLPIIQVRSDQLSDLEQRRYQFTLHRPQILRMEIMGRHLEDARIWFPNGWTSGAQPTRTIYEPEPGKPMVHLEFHHSLPAGAYELVCYGGPGQVWSVSDSSKPLYIRRDPRQWGDRGIHEITISPFGRESFQLVGQANYFEVNRSEIQQTRLRRIVVQNAESPRFQSTGYRAFLDPKAKSPQLELRTNTTQKPQWVIVEAKPGDQVTLRYFPEQHYWNLEPKPNPQYIGTLQGSKRSKTMGATGLLQVSARNAAPSFERSLLLNTSPDMSWWRQIDLQTTQEAWVRIAQNGSYTISQDPNASASARFKIVPLVRKGNRKTPPFRDPGVILDLAAGIYKLTVQPQRKGLLSFGMSIATQPLVFPIPEGPPPPVLAIAWQNVAMPPSSNKRYELLIPNHRQIPLTTFQHDWPLTLDRPLPLVLQPGETRHLQIKLKADSTVALGESLKLTALNSQPFPENGWLDKGEHTITLHNPSSLAASATLAAWSWQIAETPNAQDSTALNTIEVNRPQFFDLNRGENRSFIWSVTKPGIFRMETTGRLPTTITINGRTRARLFQGNQNGAGRNGLIQQFFKTGEYLVSVATNGAAHGRAGLKIIANSLQAEHPLAMASVDKKTIPANAAIGYTFAIEKPGRYRIETQGLDKSFPGRLEDDEGWPVYPPNFTGAAELELQPGKYHYYSLPTPLPSRRLTRIEALAPSLKIAGKGPHQLPWQKELEVTWRDGAPDIFHFEVTAPTQVSIQLTRGMVAKLNDIKGSIFGGEPWKKKLATGNYQLEISRIEPDDFFEYSVGISTQDLIPGVTQSMTSLPHSFPLVLAEQALVDIRFTGRSDIRAALFSDQNDTPIATQDDALNDWNPDMNLRLPAGRYTLEVSPVGSFVGQSQVSLSMRQEKIETIQSLPFKVKNSATVGAVRVPFRLKKNQLVHFQQTRGPSANLSLTSLDEVLGSGQKQMTIPLKKNKDYVLWAWPELDGQTLSIECRSVRVKKVNITPESSTLARGKHLHLIANPGQTYQLQSAKGLAFSAALEQPLAPLSSPLLNLAKGEGWLSGLPSKTRLVPLQIATNEPQALILDGTSALLEAKAEGPGLIYIETPDSQWRAILQRNRDSGSPWLGMGLTPGGPILAVGSSGQFPIHLWRQTPSQIPSSLKLKFLPFRLGNSLPIFDDLPKTVAIPSGEAISYSLQPKMNGFILSPDMTALWWHEDRALGFWQTLSQPREFRINADQGQLIIFNRGQSPAEFRPLRKAPYPQVTWSPDQDSHWERSWQQPHQLTLQIGKASQSHLHGNGRGVTVRFFGDSGYYWEGKPPFTLPAQKGVLTVAHGEGWLSLWQSEKNDRQRAWLGKAHEAETLKNTTITLGQKPESHSFEIETPEFYLFHMTQPGVIGIANQDRLLTSAASSGNQKVSLARFLQPGRYHLLTRPFQFTNRTGELTWDRLTIESAKKAARTYIARGETRVFQFEINTDSKVGLGLKTKSERLEAQLLNEMGDVIAKGVLMIQSLTSGTYFMVVYNPKEPVLFQPILYGLDGSQIGIPDEVIRQYLSSSTD